MRNPNWKKVLLAAALATAPAAVLVGCANTKANHAGVTLAQADTSTTQPGTMQTPPNTMDPNAVDPGSLDPNTQTQTQDPMDPGMDTSAEPNSDPMGTGGSGMDTPTGTDTGATDTTGTAPGGSDMSGTGGTGNTTTTPETMRQPLPADPNYEMPGTGGSGKAKPDAGM